MSDFEVAVHLVEFILLSGVGFLAVLMLGSLAHDIFTKTRRKK